MRVERGVAFGLAGLSVAWLAASPVSSGPAAEDQRANRAAIQLEVRYPPRDQLVAPDSNFIYGSVGSGGATLTIDGETVPVAQNGAFLAWLSVPRPTAGTSAAYSIVVIDGDDTLSVSHPIRRPLFDPPPGAERPWIDAGPLERPIERWYEPGDRLGLTVTGEGGVETFVQAGRERFDLEDLGALRGSLHRYGGELDIERLRAAGCEAGDCRAGFTSLPTAHGDSMRLGLDTVRVRLVARGAQTETGHDIAFLLARRPDRPPRALLAEAEDPINGRSGVVVGRPTPTGPYRWRFPEGTVAEVATVEGARVGLDLGAGLIAWVAAEDVLWEPLPVLSAPARVYGGRFGAGAEGAVFRLGLSRPAPAEVRQTGPNSLRLTVYGALGVVDRIAHGADAGVASIDWSQAPGPAVHLDIVMDRPVWGHSLSVESGDAREYEGPRTSRPLGPGQSPGDGEAVLALSIRRPPAIDAAAPLRGRRIAVDPGHPGAGSTGPTGLYEGDANLRVATRLVDLLAEAGATPVLVRTDGSAVGLYERTRRAREAGAELFVSIHNNALPDGIRPFDLTGTSTFYYHPHSAPLARAIQTALVRQLGLRDLGALWGDLAVVREPWMPAVLAEGAFMIVPEHEAALRTPAFRERYARGLLEGIEAFLSQFTENP